MGEVAGPANKSIELKLILLYAMSMSVNRKSFPLQSSGASIAFASA